MNISANGYPPIGSESVVGRPWILKLGLEWLMTVDAAKRKTVGS